MLAMNTVDPTVLELWSLVGETDEETGRTVCWDKRCDRYVQSAERAEGEHDCLREDRRMLLRGTNV